MLIFSYTMFIVSIAAYTLLIILNFLMKARSQELKTKHRLYGINGQPFHMYNPQVLYNIYEHNLK